MTEERFTEVFGHVVQDVPWAVERAYAARPFADTRTLREAFQDAVLTGSPEQQTELLRAFPDLGAEDEVGHALAVDHAALSNLDADDHDDVVHLAGAYREHFGFPLIICARETARFDRVLRNGWSRIDNSPAVERAFALIEVPRSPTTGSVTWWPTPTPSPRPGSAGSTNSSRCRASTSSTG